MRHLIVFSHLRWSFVYQRPQHLLTRLAAHYRVLFVEEPIRCEGAAHFESRRQGANIEILVPRTPLESQGFHDDQVSVVAPLLRSYLVDKGIDDYVVWLYTPMALPLVTPLRPRAVVYDCMDELAAFKDAPRQLRQREAALMKMSDVVLTGGPALYEAKRALNPNVHCLPSAVDSSHFSPARLALDSGSERTAAAALHAHIPAPRLGFYGVIDERLDTTLLSTLADAHRNWQLVMVGPVVKIDPQRLPQRANVHWLGMQPYERLPHLAAQWDVCLLPFALNDATRFISPTTTLEYMAAERPSVSTRIRDVADAYGHVVAIADTTAEFIDACATLLAESDAQKAVRGMEMRRILAGTSWDAATAAIHGLIEALPANVPPSQEAANSDFAPELLDMDGQSVETPAYAPIVVSAGPNGRAAAYQQILGRTRPARAVAGWKPAA